MSYLVGSKITISNYSVKQFFVKIAMERKAISYFIGTGGWEHEVFDQCLYPSPNMDSLEKLRYYSTFFDTVEVRSTFWDDSLDAKDAKAWLTAVSSNKRFLFNVKLHSSFTHKRAISSRVSRSVRSILHELHKNERLGALLVQFPYSFTNTSANRFQVVKLSEVFSGFPIHIEFRHNSWNQPPLMNFLTDNLLHLVSADYPRIKQFMPCTTGTVGDTAYLRLHGRNEKGWLLNGLDSRYDYLYNTREVRELARRLDTLSKRCIRAIVICNNTTKGKAIASALQLQSAIRKEKHLPIPKAALQPFPHLREIRSLVETDDSLFPLDCYRQAM